MLEYLIITLVVEVTMFGHMIFLARIMALIGLVWKIFVKINDLIVVSAT